MQPNFQPSFGNSRDQRIESIKHMFPQQQQQQQQQQHLSNPQYLYQSTAPAQQSVYPPQSSQLVPYAPQHNPFQMVPYAPQQQQPYGYPNPYVPNANSMALMPYNQSAAFAVPAMEAERAVQPYSAYRVRRKEGNIRVNDSDKAFGPLLDEMKQALKKKNAN
ncbi:unnamed protein product [Agarophyton chilense]|eukprot:gb/GEZJ01003233.1/.p1 GENE.gb/GEZJ01003233.1/~~gb/GEZJ01003233.1/.p1  ORF type:complete len:162 (-),score=34.21 gb/GEZJ01003233.1/:725-1210(-)